MKTGMLDVEIGSKWKKVHGRLWPKLQRAQEPTLITLKSTQRYVSSSRSALGADNLNTLCPPICFQSCQPQARLYAAHLARPGTPCGANPVARGLVTPRRSNYKWGCACSTAEEGRIPSIILWLWCWPHGCLNDGRHACCSVCTDSWRFRARATPCFFFLFFWKKKKSTK